MPRLVLVLPQASYRAAELLAAARSFGADVVVASDARQAFAGRRPGAFLEVDLGDPAGAAARIAAAVPDAGGVVSLDDQGLLAAALAGELLGVRHAEPEAVSVTRDKVAMRRLLAIAGVPQPRFAAVTAVDPPAGQAGGDAPGPGAEDEAEAVARAAARIGFPVVVKPPSLSGSRGVIRADDVAGAKAAAARCRAILGTAGEPASLPLLVESFVSGDEIAVEGMLRGGTLEVLALFDKPDPLEGPFFEETIYVTPSRHPEPLLRRAGEVVAAACAAIGLSEGPVHAEVRVDARGVVGPAGGVVVLEVASRTIGGRCAKALRFATGSSLDELVVARALGLDAGPPPPREPGGAAVLMIPIPRSGHLVAVEGLERARAVEGVTGIELTVPIGSPVSALPEGDRYLGFAFSRGRDAATAEAALRRAQAELAVIVDPGEGPDGRSGAAGGLALAAGRSGWC